MRLKRFDWDGRDPAGLAGEIRGLQPPLGEVGEVVAEIIAAVRDRGDDAVAEFEARFGASPVDPRSLPIPDAELRSGLDRLEPRERAALQTATANIRAVAEAQLAGEQRVELPQGHSVELRDVPVGSAAVYAPGGAASYPSTVLMGCIPAKVAGVERVALVTPPGGGERPIADMILAAAAIGGADEVYPVGGAQAIAALAIGTDRIPPVDVIAGPGNRFVQEAKRQLAGEVGIDGVAGPSELMVVAGDTARSDWIALDLCAQAEHGPDGLTVAAAVETVILDEIAEAVMRVTAEHGLPADAPLALVAVPDTIAAVQLANAIAPEHLELVTEDAPLLAGAVRTAGCVFVGPHSATAFGDYAAGSNHVLPTGGAGRFQGPLGPGTFRRRISTVAVTQEAARELAPTVATLARSEGFPLHADSAEIRGRGGRERSSDPIDD
jgi:histidinol dehydrogenase